MITLLIICLIVHCLYQCLGSSSVCLWSRVRPIGHAAFSPGWGPGRLNRVQNLATSISDPVIGSRRYSSVSHITRGPTTFSVHLVHSFLSDAEVPLQTPERMSVSLWLALCSTGLMFRDDDTFFVMVGNWVDCREGKPHSLEEGEFTTMFTGSSF